MMNYKKILKNSIIVGLVTMLISTSSYHGVYAVSNENKTKRNYFDNTNLIEVSGSTNGGITPTVFKDAYASHPSQQKRTRSSLPKTYDARKLGKVTTIKDQNPWGSCWSFGALSALESNMLVKRGASGNSEANTPDYSELQLAWSAYSKQTSTSLENSATGIDQVGEGQGVTSSDKAKLDLGGNFLLATAILSSWQGAADETEIPYENKDGIVSKDGDWSVPENKRNKTSVHLQNVDLLPNPTTYSAYGEDGLPANGSTYTYDQGATNSIKEAIMNNGVVGISYFADVSIPGGDRNGDYFNYINWCQFVDKLDRSTVQNHAVSVVGWDDDYSKNNFKAGRQPEENGAWLVKNSWGTNWGIDDTGYFWLSYYDHTISGATSLQGEEINQYHNNYQYDYLNLRSGYTFNPVSDPLSVANVFTTKNAEELRAVSAITTVPGAKVVVEVYILPNGKKGGPTDSQRKKVASKTVMMPYSGYHTITLDSPVKLAPGETFTIIETITDDDNNYYFPIELGSYEINQTAICNAGESFLIDKEGALDIKELAEEQNNDNLSVGNIMIKAFTTDMDTALAPSLTSFVYQAYDKAGNPLETAKTNVATTSNVALPAGVAKIKITDVTTSDGTSASITVNGKSYTLNDDIVRSDFTKVSGQEEPIVITTKSQPMGSNTKSYTFEFTTTPISVSNNGFTLTDIEYDLNPNINFSTISITKGTEFEAIKTALIPLGGNDIFEAYNLSIVPALTSGQKVNIAFTTSERYEVSEKTKLYYAILHDGVASLTEIANDSAQTRTLSADVDRLGYFIVSNVKNAPPIPKLSALTYNPTQTLADINFMTVEGGRWTWDIPSTIPTVNNSGYAATFTPSAGSKYRSYKANIDLVINKATPVISTTNATDITYGDTLSNSLLSGGATCNQQNVEGTLSWKTGTIMPVVKDSNIKEFAVQFIPSDLDNYNIAISTQTLTVNKKAITVSAENATKLYGDTNPLFMFTITDGTLVGNDTKEDLAVSLTSKATNTTAAGVTEDITGSNNSDNYDVNVKRGTLKINKRPIGCQVLDVRLSYGIKLPTMYEYQITNLVNGDTASSIGATATIAVQNITNEHLVGNYELKVTDLQVTSSNYTPSSNLCSGRLTITPVTINNVKNTSSMANHRANLFMASGNLIGSEVLILEDIKEQDILELFKKEIKKGQLLDAFDLSLDGTNTILKGTLSITIPVDPKYNGQQVTVLHYIRKGQLSAQNSVASSNMMDTYRNVTVQDGKIQITVYSLSPFAIIMPELKDEIIIPEDTTVTSKPIETSDNTNLTYIALFMMMSAIVIIFIVCKRKYKKQDI